MAVLVQVLDERTRNGWLASSLSILRSRNDILDGREDSET